MSPGSMALQFNTDRWTHQLNRLEPTFYSVRIFRVNSVNNQINMARTFYWWHITQTVAMESYQYFGTVFFHMVHYRRVCEWVILFRNRLYIVIGDIKLLKLLLITELVKLHCQQEPHNLRKTVTTLIKLSRVFTLCGLRFCE